MTYKEILDALEDIDPKARERLIHYVGILGPTAYLDTYNIAIGEGGIEVGDLFIFDETEEGFDYWHDIHVKVHGYSI